jgi:hypothetical protein
MATMKEFAKQHGVTISWEEVGSNPNMEGMDRGARHYKVVLRCKGRSMTTFFSKGSALPYGVYAHEVLNALASDWSSIQSASGVRDWARDMGMWNEEAEGLSADDAEAMGLENEYLANERAKKTYTLIEKQTDALRRVLGPAATPLLRGDVEFD